MSEMTESGTQELRKMREIGNRKLSGVVIAAAITVHRTLGPGCLESIYEEALCIELAELRVAFERQKQVPILYRDRVIGEHRLDLLIEGCLVVELKAVSKLEDIHFSIVRSYLKALHLEDALLLNFATSPLTIKRVGRENLPEFLSSRFEPPDA
jgi:GxxExxY protein